MLKLAVSKTLAQNILTGKQNLIVTNKDYNEAGDLITLINKDTQQPEVYASVDGCVCDIASHVFNKLSKLIPDFNKVDFKQATNNSPIAYILKLSQPHTANI